MTDARTLRELFERLLEHPASTRRDRLADLELDSDTRRSLERLLERDAALAASDADPVSRDHPWPGDRVGSYRLVAPLGDGGMGSVWLAVSRSAPDVRVAVKFPRGRGVAADEAVGRLEQERRILAALHHPGVVSLVDADTTAGTRPFLVLEALDGRTLDHWLDDRSPSQSRRLDLLERLAAALDHVHEHGIVHRDLKPANVLVTDDGWPVLIDFGAARVTDRAGVAAAFVTQGAAPHTPAFASPEQARGEEATTRADVFAFGKLARAVLGEHCTQDMGRVVDAACAEEPTSRPDSAGAVVAALASATTTGTDTQPRPASWVSIALAALASAWATWAVTTAPEEEPFEWLEVLERADAVELPLEAAELQGLAEDRDDPNLMVAAARKWIEVGDLGAAREIVDELEIAAEDLMPGRIVELAEVTSVLDRPGTTKELVEMLELDDLDPARAQLVLLIDFEAVDRLGHEPDREWLAETSERWLEEGDEHSIWHRLMLLRVALADAEATEWWLEEYGHLDPSEHDVESALALLGLRTRLGAARPLGEEPLEQLEEIAYAALEDEQAGGALRLLARLRAERLRDAASDAESVALLTEAVEYADDSGELPSLERALLIGALAGALDRAGEGEEAGARAEEALASAIEWAGDDAPIVASVEALIDGEIELWEVASGEAAELNAVRDLVEDADDAQSWWKP